MATTVHRREPTSTVLLLLSCFLAAAADDASAIADLARSLETPPFSWTGDADACTTFEGITCSASGRVTAIDLAGKRLLGTLPPSLTSLTALESLQLRGNFLTGVVPAGLGDIVTLRNVSLSGNLLQGPMPRFAAIDLAGNGFCSDEPGRPCSAQVTALLRVAEGLGYPVFLATAWRGNDPCRPWQGLDCSGTSARPGHHVTSINLHAANFSGTISPAMANLTELRRIDLIQTSRIIRILYNWEVGSRSLDWQF